MRSPWSMSTCSACLVMLDSICNSVPIDSTASRHEGLPTQGGSSTRVWGDGDTFWGACGPTVFTVDRSADPRPEADTLVVVARRPTAGRHWIWDLADARMVLVNVARPLKPEGRLCSSFRAK